MGSKVVCLAAKGSLLVRYSERREAAAGDGEEVGDAGLRGLRLWGLKAWAWAWDRVLEVAGGQANRDGRKVLAVVLVCLNSTAAMSRRSERPG